MADEGEHELAPDHDRGEDNELAPVIWRNKPLILKTMIGSGSFARVFAVHCPGEGVMAVKVSFTSNSMNSSSASARRENTREGRGGSADPTSKWRVGLTAK